MHTIAPAVASAASTAVMGRSEINMVTLEDVRPWRFTAQSSRALQAGASGMTLSSLPQHPPGLVARMYRAGQRPRRSSRSRAYLGFTNLSVIRSDSPMARYFARSLSPSVSVGGSAQTPSG